MNILLVIIRDQLLLFLIVHRPIPAMVFMQIILQGMNALVIEIFRFFGSSYTVEIQDSENGINESI